MPSSGERQTTARSAHQGCKDAGVRGVGEEATQHGGRVRLAPQRRVGPRPGRALQGEGQLERWHVSGLHFENHGAQALAEMSMAEEHWLRAVCLLDCYRGSYRPPAGPGNCAGTLHAEAQGGIVAGGNRERARAAGRVLAAACTVCAVLTVLLEGVLQPNVPVAPVVQDERLVCGQGREERRAPLLRGMRGLPGGGAGTEPRMSAASTMS